VDDAGEPPVVAPAMATREASSAGTIDAGAAAIVGGVAVNVVGATCAAAVAEATAGRAVAAAVGLWAAAVAAAVADAVAAAVGLWAAASQTPAGAVGGAGIPTEGTYRNPSASPSARVSDEIPMLESCHAPPARDTKIAQ
jgi:hypothetical protein